MTASIAVRGRLWYHGWNIVAVTVLAQIVASGLAVNAYSLFLHDWSTELRTKISVLQLGIMLLTLVCTFMGPLSGVLADKLPARWLFAGGLMGIAVFHFAIASMTTGWQFLALYGIFLPIAMGCCTTVVSNALVSRWFVRRLGFALGLSAFGAGLGGIVLPPIIAAAAPFLGWRGMWRVGGVFVACVVIPLAVFVLRDEPLGAERVLYTAPGASARSSVRHGAHGGSLRWRDILARRNFWMVMAVFLPAMAAFGGVSYNLAPIAASRGVGQQSAGTLLAVLSLTQVSATLVVGVLADRFGIRRPLLGLAAVVAAGSALLALGAGMPAMVVGVALIGSAGGMWTLVGTAFAKEFGAANVGRAYGLVIASLPLSALSPFLVATVKENMGSYVPSLLCLATLVVVGGILALAMRGRVTPVLTSEVRAPSGPPD